MPILVKMIAKCDVCGVEQEIPEVRPAFQLAWLPPPDLKGWKLPVAGDRLDEPTYCSEHAATKTGKEHER